ncbi:glycoside hydrolase family 32 protein [Pseudoduganella danionis]|uniref:Glycoside hydrolase family 32 protein n=1 Tax=Pseudoduganella danionis TaxID=1890295 RepID=A0ABW9SNK6_9BURK|nr:glycoside hydrolase family 32 protein [Pseudoduganella danionis]MTW32304.1 glycoside hydrolase family 32 protein [Pseudoduganella danionis]
MNSRLIRGALAASLAAPLLFAIAIAQGAGAQDSQLKGADMMQQEQYRPGYHYTPARAWMNDPNGMVYYRGVYHLFYQFHPHSNVWGPMHWGHATSPDMLHWTHQPVALAPDELGAIFSGSAVVDWNNTSGFGTPENPPLVAIYTYHNEADRLAGQRPPQSQALAYSTDQGASWTKYAGNPVLQAAPDQGDFRDPKVRWHEASNSWIMSLAVGDHVAFYASPDLKQWHFLSQFGKDVGAHGGVWECPDLLPIRVAETGAQKWLLLLSINPGGPNGGSATQYFIGDFDGRQFVLDPAFAHQLKQDGPQWIDWGRDNYAGVTWSDVPATDGRVLMLGWMSNWDYATKVPTSAWRSGMTLPRELQLHQHTQGYVLHSLPVRELDALKGHVSQPQAAELVLPGAALEQSETYVEFSRPDGSSKAYLEFSNAHGESYKVGLDGQTGRYFSDRRQAGRKDFAEQFASALHTAPRHAQSAVIKLRVYLDRNSAELFADEGATQMSELLFPTSPYTRVRFVVNGQAVQPAVFKVTQLNASPAAPAR